jgi:hypothetical protein
MGVVLMRYLIIILLFIVSFQVFSKVSFTCKHRENNQTIFKIKGIISSDGGHLRMKGAYVLGFNNYEKKYFYRQNRNREQKFEYAKFTIKSKSQYKNNEWLSPFYRLSIPKVVLTSKKRIKKFQAYFGYHKVESEDRDVLEELPVLDCRTNIL